MAVVGFGFWVSQAAQAVSSFRKLFVWGVHEGYGRGFRSYKQAVGKEFDFDVDLLIFHLKSKAARVFVVHSWPVFLQTFFHSTYRNLRKTIRLWDRIDSVPKQRITNPSPRAASQNLIIFATLIANATIKFKKKKKTSLGSQHLCIPGLSNCRLAFWTLRDGKLGDLTKLTTSWRLLVYCDVFHLVFLFVATGSTGNRLKK